METHFSATRPTMLPNEQSNCESIRPIDTKIRKSLIKMQSSCRLMDNVHDALLASNMNGKVDESVPKSGFFKVNHVENQPELTE